MLSLQPASRKRTREELVSLYKRAWARGHNRGAQAAVRQLWACSSDQIERGISRCSRRISGGDPKLAAQAEDLVRDRLNEKFASGYIADCCDPKQKFATYLRRIICNEFRSALRALRTHPMITTVGAAPQWPACSTRAPAQNGAALTRLFAALDVELGWKTAVLKLWFGCEPHRRELDALAQMATRYGATDLDGIRTRMQQYLPKARQQAAAREQELMDACTNAETEKQRAEVVLDRLEHNRNGVREVDLERAREGGKRTRKRYANATEELRNFRGVIAVPVIAQIALGHSDQRFNNIVHQMIRRIRQSARHLFR